MTSQELVLYGKGKSKGGDHRCPPGMEDPFAKKIARRTIDYGSTVVRWLEDCLVRKMPEHRLQCHYSYTKDLMPPFATPQSPYDAICCRFVHSSTNKSRAPVNVVQWFPNGRRLITGAQTGEITIWNGFQFHFENILQAHNSAVRAMEWTPNEEVLVSGDQLGVVKFWDQYFYNFQTMQAHKESICDLSIAPTGLKFCSCADDSHAKVWDLQTNQEERAFTGHGWDVKCCHWHPTKGLVATGSKDSQIKLWDPRAGEAITTIFCHKNTVTRVKWSPDGQWLASGSRDQLVMLMDIRTMSVRNVFRAHQKEVTALCWHPETDALLASGGYDAAIHYWDTHGSSKPIESLPNAHDGPVWCLAWQPLGHLLVSGSHDYSTRFWSRARPGDTTFTDLVPKKVSLPEPNLQAVSGEKISAATALVLESGIFAGPPKPPPPPPTPEELAAIAAAALAKKEAETLALTAPKATLAIEAKAKPTPMSLVGIGDTSDFDAEDRAAGSVSTKRPASTEAAPTKEPEAKRPCLAPKAESAVSSFPISENPAGATASTASPATAAEAIPASASVPPAAATTAVGTKPAGASPPPAVEGITSETTAAASACGGAASGATSEAVSEKETSQASATPAKDVPKAADAAAQEMEPPAESAAGAEAQAATSESESAEAPLPEVPPVEAEASSAEAPPIAVEPVSVAAPSAAAPGVEAPVATPVAGAAEAEAPLPPGG